MSQLLIVDDEAHVVERLAIMVPWESIGITEVHKAFSAYEALELLASRPIDLVITDIRMPGMDGLELAGHIQQQWRKTKCILLSGHAEFEYAKEAITRGTADYLLKPVTDKELLAAVSRVLGELQEEWAAVISRERIARTLRENLPQLKGNLLNELLLGKRYSETGLQERMVHLELPAIYGETFRIMLLRLEESFMQYDAHSLALLEYAIGNMAEELFDPQFALWHCKDAHDYLVFVIKQQPPARLDLETARLQLERAAGQLQEAVAAYLKGRVTVLLSRRGVFPGDLSALYAELLSAMRKRVGVEQELFLTVADGPDDQAEIQTLVSLYELPTLTQLMEAGKWKEIEDRCERIFGELRLHWSESQDHRLEVFFAISSASSHFAHKNGRHLADLIGGAYDKLIQGTAYRSFEQLQDWTREVLHGLRIDAEGEAKDSKAQLVREVQAFVESRLAEDVSLTAIAAHVYMHPVYISKIYKLETGENISDYVYRIRMEKAAQLLLNSQSKIYEIAAEIGYQRAHSFIHVFKKHTGLTPQEYRDKYMPSS
ncbi:response regulator [Paenibacillus thalictri]|uniref:Response regulator n=1 Tax=Paenibacillus thalictri TaxID=2527873 RepID=A0A4Q9DF05_9BACL|nr:response regulator [Paenibacillus thalictri]TBL70388.1 response regulator [Paenibacillus thalictri]